MMLTLVAYYLIGGLITATILFGARYLYWYPIDSKEVFIGLSALFVFIVVLWVPLLFLLAIGALCGKDPLP
jgi:hypothetical protein